MSVQHQPETLWQSLRQSLRDLLRRRRRATPTSLPQIVGSGILRTVEVSISYLPTVSTISLFPDFGTSEFDGHQYSTASSLDVAQEQTLRQISAPSQVTLLPATRLSQFNLRNTYHEQANWPLYVQYETVPDDIAYGASRQASLTSLANSSLRPRPSTLRISRSTQFEAGRAGSSDSPISSRIDLSRTGDEVHAARRTSSVLHNPRHFKDTGALTEPTSSIKPVISRPLSVKMNTPNSIQSIRHFGSFCVLDTATPGCPVTATSADLRYIFDVGEQFFLNNQECQGTSIDVVTGMDAAGNEITHLVLFSPLVAPSSGRSRFMLAALVDVTSFIHRAASLPDLDTIAEESTLEEKLSMPRSRSIEPFDMASKYQLSADDLLGGCSVREDTVQGMSRPDFWDLGNSEIAEGMSDDIWLKLAMEAQLAQTQPSSTTTRSGRRSVSTPPRSSQSPSNVSATSSTVDDVLEDFMSNLQHLYCDFFLLAKSPLDDGFYEICNVSSSIYASKDYINGHLSHTSASAIARLSARLGSESPFNMSVKWGVNAQRKRLYCVPLFGQRSLTWICLLVDNHVPILW